MTRSTLILICLLLICLISFDIVYSRDLSESEMIVPVVDARSLPYRFQEGYEQTVRLDNQGIDWAFMEPERRESDGVFFIQHNWRPEDTLTSVIYSNNLIHTSVRDHKNISVIRCNDWISYDADDNGIPDVATLFTKNDTIWLYRYSPSDSVPPQVTPLYWGEDVNEDGYWDGYGWIELTEDYNHDGIKDIFTSLDTGYDSTPRELTLVDGADGSVIWRYYVASPVGPVGTIHTRQGRVLIAPTASKGNSVEANGMNDSQSYLIVLDSLGNRLWYRETGGVFSSARVVFSDIDQDAIPEIVSSRHYQAVNAAGDSVRGGCLLAFDLKGNVKDSIDFGIDLFITKVSSFDYDSDGIEEILVTTDQEELHILTPELEPIAILKSDVDFVVWLNGDFIGNGGNQMLLLTDGGKMMLVDSDLELLAQADAKYNFYNSSWFRPANEESKIALHLKDKDGKRAVVVNVVPNPWFTVFFRKPWLAAAAGGAPILLIAGVIAFYNIRVRRKNRLIAETNQRLETALTKLRDAQQKLVEAEKYQQARNIAGGVAHEIRNALCPAANSMHLLKNLNLSENEKKMIQLVNSSINRAMKTTDLVGHYTKLESETGYNPVSIGDTVKQALEENRARLQQSDIEVTTDIDEEITVVSNPLHLYSIMNNLILNAIDALEQTASPRIVISAQGNRSEVIIKFSDNGEGIREEDIPKIFELFYSGKPATGSGFGLAIVRRILSLYDARIEVDSAIDKGTTFTIFWPRFSGKDNSVDQSK